MSRRSITDKLLFSTGPIGSAGSVWRPEAKLLRSLPAGSLTVEQVR